MKYIRQPNDWTCGPTALVIALSEQGIERDLDSVITALGTSPAGGTTDDALIQYVHETGLEHLTGRDPSLANLRTLREQGFSVLIVYYDHEEKFGHYAAVRSITDTDIVLADPYEGPHHTLTHQEFIDLWHDSKGDWHWFLAFRKKTDQQHAEK